MSNFVDEPPSLTERFDTLERRLDMIGQALGFILAGAVGKGGTKDDIEKLITELGFKPASNLLMGVR